MAAFNQGDQKVPTQYNAETINIQQGGGDSPLAPSGTGMESKSPMPTWEKIVGLSFGVVFISILLALSVLIPDPTPTQESMFRTILAIAAAGVGGVLAGFIHVEGNIAKWTVKSGGALALFVIVYFFSPVQASAPIDVDVTVEEGGEVFQHTGSGDINFTENNE